MATSTRGTRTGSVTGGLFGFSQVFTDRRDADRRYRLSVSSGLGRRLANRGTARRRAFVVDDGSDNTLFMDVIVVLTTTRLSGWPTGKQITDRARFSSEVNRGTLVGRLRTIAPPGRANGLKL